MRIVHVTHSFCPGKLRGLEKQVVLLAAEQARADHKPYLFTLAPTVGGDPLTASDPFIAINWTNRPHRAANPLTRFMATFLNHRAEADFKSLLNQLRPEVVHIHHTSHLSVRLSCIASKAGAAVIQTFHDYWWFCHQITLTKTDQQPCSGPGNGFKCGSCWRPSLLGSLAGPAFAWRTLLHRRSLDYADAIILPAAFMIDICLANGLDRRRLNVVPYGLPDDPPRQVETKRTGPLKFGYLGTIRPHKGVHLIPTAIKRLETPVRIRIIGRLEDDPDYIGQIEAAASGLDLEWAGEVDNRGVPDELAGLDALIVPSLWPETGPVVVLEALQVGLPVIGADIGGITELLRERTDCRLFPVGSVSGLAEALAGLTARLLALRDTDRRPGRVPSMARASEEVEAVYRRITEPWR